MQKRIIALASAVLLTFLSMIGRTGYIAMSGVYSVGDSYNSYTLTLNMIEPTLYYNDGTRMTNNSEEYLAIIKPTVKCMGELSKIFSYSEEQEILSELKNGKPIVRKLDKDYDTRYIRVVSVPTSKRINNHFITKESGGLKKYIQDDKGRMQINYDIDAKGMLLSGDNGQIVYDNYNENYGYVLTIDRRIQRIANEAMAKVSNGSVIVTDIESGAIVAAVSKPDSSYINKNLRQYSVGSVFKTVVAISALENKISTEYVCTGEIKVGDTYFSCSHNQVHGQQNLESALANSCNCYFVNLALTLGANRIEATSKRLGFCDSTSLFAGWKVKNAIFPSSNELASKGELALLGFGQGKLLCTPLQISSLMCTVANGGVMSTPYLVQSRINRSNKEIKLRHDSKRVIDEKVANIMKKYLRTVVASGTGIAADTDITQTAGKTGTAQTGQYRFGAEMLNSWFAGFYPVDEPKYAIVVMVENGTSGSKDCCPIFRTIVEKIESK